MVWKYCMVVMEGADVPGIAQKDNVWEPWESRSRKKVEKDKQIPLTLLNSFKTGKFPPMLSVWKVI